MKNDTFWKVLLAIFCVFVFFKMQAQTILTPGDIVIVNVNADDPDYFDFVPLVDLETGTIINFTDIAWTGTSFATNEGTKIYTASAPVTKGTVLSYTGTNTGDWTSSGSYNAATGGDNLLAYQGTATTPTFLYGIGWASASPWITTGTVTTNNSYIPTNLSEAAKTIVTLGSLDNYRYDVTKGVTGTKSELLSLIANVGNWQGDDINAFSQITESFTINEEVGPVVPTITVTEIEVPTMETYVNTTSIETINVSGVNLNSDISLSLSGANPTAFELSTNVIPQSNGVTTNTIVSIKYNPTEVGTHTATLTLSSQGADAVIRDLKGESSLKPSIPDVIITEVYGGGGNSGAPYQNDFIELYNNTESSIDISGWSIQHYSYNGTSAGVTTIPASTSLAGKKYFLIQGAGSELNGLALSDPDVIGTFALAANAGKVILFSTSSLQTIDGTLASITGNENFVDYVPYGSTAVPVWGSSTVNLSNTTSASRIMVAGEYKYTPNIGLDFEVVTPNPQNSGFTTAVDETALNNKNVSVENGKIKFIAVAGETIEVFNAVGQRLISQTTLDGLNSIQVTARGVVLVKIGARISKVIM